MVKSNKKLVVYDDYTSRLVKVFNSLATLPAFTFVKDFTDRIQYDLSNWGQVRNRERNYPRKRRQATTNILEKEYGVNPLYLNGLSETMFVRKPRKLETEGPTDYLLLEFRNKNKKKLLLEELTETRDVNEELRKQLQILQEENAAYKRIQERERSDKNPDKKPQTAPKQKKK